jgi:hypothetical protein
MAFRGLPGILSSFFGSSFFLLPWTPDPLAAFRHPSYKREGLTLSDLSWPI